MRRSCLHARVCVSGCLCVIYVCEYASCAHGLIHKQSSANADTCRINAVGR